MLVPGALLAHDPAIVRRCWGHKLRLMPWPAVCLLLVLLAVPGIPRAEAARVVFATPGARVEAADGSVRAVERGGSLLAGETIDTGDGRVQLRFRDKSSISLQPQTRFRVEEFRFAEQNGRASEGDRLLMRFLKGALRAVSGLVGHERREQYRMETRVGTIGIRGTEYGATLGDDGLVVAVYGGGVEVCNAAGCAQAGAGQSLHTASQDVRPHVVNGESAAQTPTGAVPDLPSPAQGPVQVSPIQVEVPATTTTTTTTHGPRYTD